MNIIGHRRWWYILSICLIIPGVAAIATWGLPVGIDFRGGTLIEIETKNETSPSTIKDTLEKNGYRAVVTSAGQGRAQIRIPPLEQEKKGQLQEQLRGGIGEYTEVSFQTVGPTVSRDLTTKALWAILLASIGIIVFIAWAFRRVPRPASSWRFGFVAIVALLHDLLTTVGVFAIVAHYTGYEIDSLFITALLTVLGFSVHDTIVIFDRIRENLRLHPSQSFAQVANFSVVQTFARSLGTSLTVVLVLSALYIFGGTSIHGFVFTLLFGIIIGTYSSIFIAAPLLPTWQNRIHARVKGHS